MKADTPVVSSLLETRNKFAHFSESPGSVQRCVVYWSLTAGVILLHQRCVLTWNLVKWKKGQIKNGLIMQKNKVTNRKVTDPDRKWTT